MYEFEGYKLFQRIKLIYEYTDRYLLGNTTNFEIIVLYYIFRLELSTNPHNNSPNNMENRKVNEHILKYSGTVP